MDGTATSLCVRVRSPGCVESRDGRTRRRSSGAALFRHSAPDGRRQVSAPAEKPAAGVRPPGRRPPVDENVQRRFRSYIAVTNVRIWGGELGTSLGQEPRGAASGGPRSRVHAHCGAERSPPAGLPRRRPGADVGVRRPAMRDRSGVVLPVALRRCGPAALLREVSGRERGAIRPTTAAGARPGPSVLGRPLSVCSLIRPCAHCRLLSPLTNADVPAGSSLFRPWRRPRCGGAALGLEKVPGRARVSVQLCGDREPEFASALRGAGAAVGCREAGRLTAATGSADESRPPGSPLADLR